jgi:nicotinamidase-related amidase
MEETIEEAFPIFFNINTQRDFFEGGTYKIPSVEHILTNLNDITQYAKMRGAKVVSTVGWYHPNSKFLSDTPDYNKTYPKHCVMNTEGAKFLKETSPESYFLMDWNSPQGLQFHELHENNNVVVTKKSRDFFEGNTYSESLVHNLGIPIMQRPIFLVYGIDIGPTVLGLLKRGYSVKVIDDANRNLNGMPFKKNDVIDEKQNPYPDQIVAPLIDETPLTFISTKEVLSL